MAEEMHNPTLTSEMKDNINIIRGDAVGSTMYSERWIIKILMRLTKLTSEEWTLDLEDEICILWDMSAEADVVQLLMQHDILDLATHVILNSDEPRLTELMVGIIGNLCCVETVRNELGRKPATIELLLDLLSFPDAPTLIQVMRVLQTCAWDVRKVSQFENQSQNEPGSDNKAKIMSGGESEKRQECCKIKPDQTIQIEVEKEQRTLSVSVETCVDVQGDHRQNEQELMGLTLTKDPVENQQDENILQKDVVAKENVACNALSGKSGSFETQLDADSKHIEKPNSNQTCCIVEFWQQQFKLTDSWLPKITFLLNSSKNDELLSCIWSFLDTVCYIHVEGSSISRLIATSDVIVGLLESYKEYFSEVNDIEPVKKAAGHWVSIMSSFTLHSEGIHILCQYNSDIMRNIFQMFHYCHTNILLDEELAEFITSSVVILDAILLAEPYQLNCLQSGLQSAAFFWDELVSYKAAKRKRSEDTQLVEEVLRSLEEYFTRVIIWLNSKKEEKRFKKLHDVHELLSVKLESKVT